MLPKKNRLKKKKDFERIFKRGKGYREDSLLLRVISNNLQFSRFGFIISQKVSKKAVVRNKIKRRLRAIIRESLPKIKKGIDGVIIIVGSGIENNSFKEIKEKVGRLIKKAKLLEND